MLDGPRSNQYGSNTRPEGRTLSNGVSKFAATRSDQRPRTQKPLCLVRGQPKVASMNSVRPERVLVRFADEVVVYCVLLSLRCKIEVKLGVGGIAAKARSLEHIISLSQHIGDFGDLDISRGDDT